MFENEGVEVIPPEPPEQEAPNEDELNERLRGVYEEAVKNGEV